MKEEDMDRYIRDLARHSYNPPPEPPRDELWARIEAARQATAPSAAPAAASQPDVIDIRSRRSAQIRRWSYRLLPMAALLLLAFGLGRLSLVWQSGKQPVASAPTTSPATPRAPIVATPGAQPSGVAPGTLAAGQPVTATPSAAAPTQVALAPSAAATRPASRNGSTGRPALYRLVAAQTLGQAEMLLTSFRAETRSGGTLDPQVVTWAGDVLSSTRLLLDSPAGRDPKLRPLLEDLELVLAQIVQLRAAPAGTAGADADLIDHALQQRDIMPRLRTAVPAGAIVGI